MAWHSLVTTHEDLSIKMVEMSTDYDGLKGELRAGV